MGQAQDRSDALLTLVAAQRAQKTALAAIVATLGVNSITAQNITDITAAGAAYDAAILAANATLRSASAGG